LAILNNLKSLSDATLLGMVFVGISLVPLKLGTIKKLLLTNVTSKPMIVSINHMLFVISRNSDKLMTDWALELWFTMCQQVHIQFGFGSKTFSTYFASVLFLRFFFVKSNLFWMVIFFMTLETASSQFLPTEFTFHPSSYASWCF